MTQTIRYSRFHEHILPNLEVDCIEPEIRGIYGAQIGHLVLSSADFVAKDDADELTLEEILAASYGDSEDHGDKIENEFLTALKESPHSFGLKEENLPKVTTYDSHYLRYSFTFDRSLSFSIKIPASKKKFDFLEDETEQFNILMTGSNYVAYVELDDCPEQIFVGQEFREQIRELLDRPANTFRLGQVGPAPMHPRFYVVDIANENFTHREIHSYNEDVYIFVNLNLSHISAKDIYEEILEHTRFELELFYTLGKYRSLLINLHTAIHNRLQDIVKSYMQLGTNLFYVNFQKLAKMRLELLLIHRANLRLELSIGNYENERKQFLSILENNIFFDELEEYFGRMTEKDLTVSDALFKTLEYMEKSISSIDVAIRTIFAAVIGAMIGAFVALLLRL